MKKSPLSRISENRGYNRSPYGHRQFHNSSNHDNLKSGNNYHSFNRQDNSQSSGGSDYIPFETSSPLSQRSNSGSWQGVYSSGYRNRRTNYSSPTSNQSSPHSPYNNTPKHNYKRQNFRSNCQKIVDITAYLDFESMFENPWTELEGQLNNWKSQNESKTFENDNLGDSKLENSSLSPEDSLSDNCNDKNLSDSSQDIKSTTQDS
ncbi:hybrid signal transduction histidine kinase L-like [Leptopilina boulardi]|uniref:hybrid signal transduction histidine kinase L-like n=1 Tax=Leptopilina boulardi TaxID=63433 RepID=UPI0021F5C013|nr:hybrid signal transduction histidine kinase L-like [Leptopilina boulardi]